MNLKCKVRQLRSDVVLYSRFMGCFGFQYLWVCVLLGLPWWITMGWDGSWCGLTGRAYLQTLHFLVLGAEGT